MERNCLLLRKTPQKTRTFFKTADGLPSDNVTALCFAPDGTLFIGTDRGLCLYNGKKITAVGGITMPVKELYACDCGKLFVLSGNLVYTVSNKKVEGFKDFGEPAVDICRDGAGVIWLITDSCLYKYENGSFVSEQRLELAGATAMTALGKGEVYAFCPAALNILHGKRPSWAVVMPSQSYVPSTAVNTMISDEWGHVWCGSDDGLMIYDGKSEWLTPDDSNALPKCRITKLVFGNDGARYIGTDIGLYIQSGTHYSFVGAERWLPASSVNAIAVKDTNDEYWVGTPGGLSRITLKLMSLEEKAAYYQDMTAKYHNREGYINNRQIVNGDIDNGVIDISDNDGLWTATFVASQCFRYAVTKDPDAAAKARESMNALLKLQSISGIEGFPARAYRRPGEDRFGDGDIEWHLAEDEKSKLEWKGETSSDEMVGHYYASAWYFDLVADEDEKKKIAESIKKITEHVLSHDYTLCDADGLPCTWSNWNPDDLNCNDTWFWEKGVNSLELLSFLKITYHMTGEEKYNDIYKMLVKKYHYALNTVTYKIDDNHACHIDDKLGFYAIHNLMTYETDPQLLKYYQMGIKYHFEVERIERCATWNFIYGGLTNEPCDVENAVRTLQETPLDLIRYGMNNTIRPDVEIDHSPEIFGGKPHAKIPLPADERPSDRLTYNAFKLDSRPGADSCVCPSSWLLPYWMGRYYGLFSE